MIGHKSSFVILNEEVKSQLKLGDGNLQKAEGKGVIAVQTKGGMTKGLLMCHWSWYVVGVLDLMD